MAATAVRAGRDQGEGSRRVRSPSPALPLLDPRCCGDDFSFEGAGFEELLRSLGGGLDSPLPGAVGALPHAPPQSELALALPLPQRATRTPEAVGPRCLDAAHAGSAGLGGACACTPAPLEGTEAQYELLSNENGKKNGEKRRDPQPTPLAPLARAWCTSRVRLTRPWRPRAGCGASCRARRSGAAWRSASAWRARATPRVPLAPRWRKRSASATARCCARATCCSWRACGATAPTSGATARTAACAARSLRRRRSRRRCRGASQPW